MKQFHYIIKDKERRTKKGNISFESEDMLREHFHNLKYMILSLTEVETKTDIAKNESGSDAKNLAKILIPCIVIGLIFFAIIKKQINSDKAKPIALPEKNLVIEASPSEIDSQSLKN